MQFEQNCIRINLDRTMSLRKKDSRTVFFESVKTVRRSDREKRT